MTSRINLLAIDPGTRELGFAHFAEGELIDQNVKSLRRYNPPEKRVMVLNRALTRLIDEKMPDAIALEKNAFAHVEQNAPLMELIRKIRAIAMRRDIPLYELAPSTVKKLVTGDGRATKAAVAKVLCQYYPQLIAFKNTRRQWQARFNQNMFDAVGCGHAWFILRQEHQLKHYAVGS